MTTIDAMRLLRTSLVLLLVIGFTPGVMELLSDGAHLVLQGHSAHAQHDGEHGGAHGDEHGHRGPGAEHGCTGWHHTCPCHTSLSLIAGADLVVLATVHLGVAPLAFIATGAATGVSFGIERPPRA